MMIIRGLGVIAPVHRGELIRLQPAQRTILAVLMAAGPEGLSADRFADEVWSDSQPEDWETAVRQSISRMRRAIGLNTIVNSTKHYSLDPDTQVDVWRLLGAADASLEEYADAELVLMISGEPYPGVDPTPIVRASIEQIVAARISMIIRLVDRADRVTAGVLDASRSFLLQQPYREDVLAATARLHIAAGLGGPAVRLLDEGVGRLEAELEGPIGPDLFELHAGLLLDWPGAHTSKIADAPAQVVGNIGISTVAVGIDRPGLLSTAKGHLDRGGVVVTGESGSGKTVLVRRLAAQAFAEGAHLIWLTAQRHQTAAYGPFFASLPWLHRHLSPLMTDDGDANSQSSCWSASLDALTRAFPGRLIAIFVDDAQWLDSHSQMFLEFMTASRTARGLRIAVVGRRTEDHDGWDRLLSSLSRSGLESVETTEFTHAELIDLVGRSHPSATSKQRFDLASELAEGKAALPAIADELLRAADPATLISSYRSSAVSDRGVWTNRVSQAAQDVGAKAAVAGITFRLESLSTLTGHPSRDLIPAIDELLDAELVVTGHRPDEFGFRHILIHEAFEALLELATLRELHLVAARTELGTDPHRKAAHFLAAGPLVPADELSDALFASALIHREIGSFREAVQAFSRAIQIDSGRADERLLLSYANSLDLSGGDGWAIRAQAFDAAQAVGDHEFSVEVAIAGAHESEHIDGDGRRAALLDRVELTQLGVESTERHHVALARELSFLGQHERSLKLSEQVVGSANGPEGRCAGWLSSWPTYLTTPVRDWPPLPSDRQLVNSSELRAQMLQVECVRSLLAGEDASARDRLAQCAAPAMTQNPLRAWFVSLLQAMMTCTDGHWALSNEIADAGLAAAQRAGISAAFSARAAQVFAQKWICGKHGELLPLLEAAAPDVQKSMLAEAAYAVSLATDPARQDSATTAIDALAARAAESGSPLASSVAAVLASATTDASPPRTVEVLSSLVEPFLGTALVVGTGVANMGPASRAVSMLARTLDDKVALLGSAIDEADRWNLRVWSVRCRLDLAELTGDRQLRLEARERSEGTDLAFEMFDD